ncbi:COG3143: Chemotaxis protein [hydrothermal vent metagenome]|uniref:COG3143: Chemotaxis protein n=1 Tax=hydrothermal vent metagenome TaxID=652676 RepID=A0A3B0RWV7_9ZZZZ
MAPGLLPEHIGPLVDRLRSGDHKTVSLPEVAALTEVLMRSLESYFKSIDMTIYRECKELADFIDDARLEISSLSPDHSDEVGIPRAGLELEAIVQQTEQATNTIMESAEQIMEADSSDIEAYTGTVNDAVMQIFEACSFQDITGQRISKVVSTLEHVEDRVSRLVNILGVMEGAQPASNQPEEEIDENAALLNGPALEGEGMEQSEIDDLLNGKVDDKAEILIDDDKAPEIEATEQAEPVAETSEDASAEDIDFMFAGNEEDGPQEVAESVPAEEPNLIEQAKQQKAEAQARKKEEAAPPKPVAYEEDGHAGLDPKATENTTQSDIDALFS